MKTKTNIKAGGGPTGINHNETLQAAVRVKTTLKAGVVPDSPD